MKFLDKNKIINSLSASDKEQSSFIQKKLYSQMTSEDINFISEKNIEIICNNLANMLSAGKISDIIVFDDPSNSVAINLYVSEEPEMIDSIKLVLAKHYINYNCFYYTGGKEVSGIFISIIALGNFSNDVLEKVLEEINNTIHQVQNLKNVRTNSIELLLDFKNRVLAGSLEQMSKNLSTEPGEAIDFINWLEQKNFLFLSACKIDKSGNILEILGRENLRNSDVIENFASEVKPFEGNLIEIGKLNILSAIQKNEFVDYILIRPSILNPKFGSGESLALFGLFSANINYQSITSIPEVRRKFNFITESPEFISSSFYVEKLRLISESLPKLVTMHASKEDLLNICLSSLKAMVNGQFKLFAIGNCKQNFVEFLILIPRGRLTVEAHKKIQDFLVKKYNAQKINEFVSEVDQGFVFLFITFASKFCPSVKSMLSELEVELEKITNWWHSDFKNYSIKDVSGNLPSSLTQKYLTLFPSDYKFKFSSEDANYDIIYLEKLIQSKTRLHFKFNHDKDGSEKYILSVYTKEHKLSLSETMPMIENFGFKVCDEQSFNIKIDDLDAYIQKYSLQLENPIQNINEVYGYIEDTLTAITAYETESDTLTKLVIAAELPWREVSLIRAILLYIHQTNFSYSTKYISNVLVKHNSFTKQIVDIFKFKFCPISVNLDEAKNIFSKLESYLIDVSSSSEDLILRTLLGIINAIVRTSYYQTNANGGHKNYISFKFASVKVPNLVKPVPYAEIFVFSKDFEGIHLRGGKVARGGIRWSDRGEDYRTEVLGLMKAQMTKNSVIVPVGSKGGFYIKKYQPNMTAQERQQYVIECYKNFLRGLLDITDNIIDNKIVRPKDCVIHDKDDPYLVVAADKGTATFSDYANQVSAEYNFWLGDAFASGGSAGYDHKKLAITARGAWISVQGHFKEMGVDVQNDPITVVGIGDMAGDVFGNGMLLSKSIKLIAAFNHMHIFIDPDPDPKSSFIERERLFNLAGSKWSDYSLQLISKGGGVYERSQKTILLSPEATHVLALSDNEQKPEDVIKAILKADVDLIWNGGIGTYVKASNEEHYSVGDKNNDNLRINASELRAKVISEGGNLGLSQKARIEYAKLGGKINTDFIDNSAGVDCSDHEVNLKIALEIAVQNNKLNVNQRDKLLGEMQNEVSELVLQDNIDQTHALTFMEHSSIFTMEMFSLLIDVLEAEKLLERKVESISEKTELHQRSIKSEFLTRPELAVLLSYSKRSVAEELMETNIVNDEYFKGMLLNYFPNKMSQNFSEEILSHPLKQEIIITVITNKIINQLSGPILSNLKKETGALLCDLVRGFAITNEIFSTELLWQKAMKLPQGIPLDVSMEIFTDVNKVLRRGINWMVANLKQPLDVQKVIKQFKEKTLIATKLISQNLTGSAKEKFHTKLKKYLEAGIDEISANEFARLDSLISALDIVTIADITNEKVEKICPIYFKVGCSFNLDWLRKSCDKLINDSYWMRLSLQTIKDDIYNKQRELIKKIVLSSDFEDFEDWFKKHKLLVSKYSDFVEGLKHDEVIDISKIIVINKKLEMLLRKI